MKTKNGLQVKTNIKAGVVNDNNNGKGKGTGNCPPGWENNGSGCVSIAGV